MNNAFTSTTGGAPNADELRENMRRIIETCGPPRCLVIMPNGDVCSGTIVEMSRMLQHQAMHTSKWCTTERGAK